MEDDVTIDQINKRKKQQKNKKNPKNTEMFLKLLTEPSMEWYRLRPPPQKNQFWKSSWNSQSRGEAQKPKMDYSAGGWRMETKVTPCTVEFHPPYHCHTVTSPLFSPKYATVTLRLPLKYCEYFHSLPGIIICHDDYSYLGQDKS